MLIVAYYPLAHFWPFTCCWPATFVILPAVAWPVCGASLKEREVVVYISPNSCGMKRNSLLFFILMSVCLISARVFFAEPSGGQGALYESPPFQKIIEALKEGKAKEIAKFFDNTVEITIADKNNSYSRSQAEMVLHDFFLNNHAKDFQVIHQSENEVSWYCIGNLTTTSGLFRTTIYLKQKGNKPLIQELRFEH